eukprot:COSAG05_NODE_332_length_11268_cov_132.023726_7_plen_397_part_00
MTPPWLLLTLSVWGHTDTNFTGRALQQKCDVFAGVQLVSASCCASGHRRAQTGQCDGQSIPETCSSSCAEVFIPFLDQCADILSQGGMDMCSFNALYFSCHQVGINPVESATMIYAVGGVDENDIPLTTAERYDPDTNSWTPIASMGTARGDLGLTTFNNTLYAVGGYNTGNTLTTEYNSATTAERYDPNTNSWTPIASMGTTLTTLTTLSNNLYAVGGNDKYGDPLTTAERYDPDTNSWTPIASMGTARLGLGLTALTNNLYAVGGYDGNNILNTAERYDPDTNSWTPIASMGTARWFLGLTTLNNNLYAVGGSGLTTAERYDPDTNSWTPIASMGTARDSLGLTTLTNNLYAVGGHDENDNILSSSERYDPDTNSWTPIASMGTARGYFALTAL